MADDVDRLIQMTESKSFFGFDRQSNKIISTKSKLLKEFDELLPKTSLESIYGTERDLRQMLIMARVSQRVYQKAAENLYEMFLYLNELSVPRFDLDRDETTEQIVSGFRKAEHDLAPQAISSVMKIKESIRALLGANGAEPLLNDLIANAQKQEEILRELLQPGKTEGFVVLEERYNELKKYVEQEQAISRRVDSHIKEVMTRSAKLAKTTRNYLDYLKALGRNLRSWNQNNAKTSDKVMALSKYFNQHASVIALSVVGLSATMFLGSIFGAPAALLATVSEIFHLVATGGEGIQAIEEVKGLRQWISKVFQHKMDDKAFVEELRASAA